MQSGLGALLKRYNTSYLLTATELIMKNTAKKLGILIPEFPSQTHIFFWREILALRDMGCEVHIVSTKKPDLSKNQHEFSREVANTRYLVPFPVLKVLWFNVCNFQWLYHCLRYCFRLKQSSMIEKFKVILFIPVAANLIFFVREKGVAHIHAHSCANSAHLVALANLYSGLPYSISVHGNLSEYGKDHVDKMRNAKFIATVTKPLQGEVLDACPMFTEERVPVIAMGVDLSRFSVSGVKRLEGRPFKLCSISRLAFVKGHSYTLQALARLPAEFDYHFSIVGDGEMRNSLEAEVKTLGLEGRVTFLGFRPESEVINILEDADIFLLTSFGKGEAAPVAVMEAMASGKAVICSIIGGTRDMINDGDDAFLVRQQDPDDIARVLQRLMEDEKLLYRIGERARERAEKQFSHIANAKKLRDQIFVS